MPVRVAIVDDDAPYRGAIADLLALESAFQMVASFGEARSLLAAAEKTPPPTWDLVLMDIEMPGLDGISAARELKARLPGATVVMLTAFEEPDRIVRAILAGADGYLVKRSDAREVLEEIRSIVAGGSPMTPSVARSVLATVRAGLPLPPGAQDGLVRYGLSEREADVLRALVAGKGYKEIAYDLHISVDTVRSHIRKVYGKLQVHSAPEAVARAIRERLV
ncbi:MAG TPA: response regulator transcription factor [Candidatus Polarisedimenticolaceae bacterium]|nr:response regulator transcription factor [Candidatus Polarisedimenticolaceae bacterium]